MKLTVFIHTNPQQYLGAKVAEYAMRKTSSNNDKFDVKIINLPDYQALYKYDGQPYLRAGKRVLWNNRDLQSFTPLRFLPPQLMGYQGRAIVIDPDVFALSDIYELLTQDMQGKPILCRKMYRSGKAHYYASSVMLLDCAQLTHWQWEKQIDEMFSFKRDYRPWNTLLMEPEDSIGYLAEEWNHYDTLNEKTKLLHNTQRNTQPWKTGLPIDYIKHQNYETKPIVSPKKKFGIIPPSWISQIKALFQKNQEYSPHGFYEKHPDPNQEKFFFSLFKECLEQGVFTEDYVQSEIEKKHIRPDMMQVLEHLNLNTQFMPRTPKVSTGS